MGLGVSAHLVSTVKWLAVPTRPLSRPGPCARTRVGSQPSVTPTRNGLLGTATSSYVTSTRCSPVTGTPSHTAHGGGTRGLWGGDSQGILGVPGWGLEGLGGFGDPWMRFWGEAGSLWLGFGNVSGGSEVPGSGDPGGIEGGPHLDMVWEDPSLRVPHEEWRMPGQELGSQGGVGVQCGS